MKTDHVCNSISEVYTPQTLANPDLAFDPVNLLVSVDNIKDGMGGVNGQRLGSDHVFTCSEAFC